MVIVSWTRMARPTTRVWFWERDVRQAAALVAALEVEPDVYRVRWEVTW